MNEGSDSIPIRKKLYQRIALLMISSVAIIGILAIILNSRQGQFQKPSITLKDGRVLSLEGITSGMEPFLYADPSTASYILSQWPLRCIAIPKSLLNFFGMSSPWIKPSPTWKKTGDDITFWILIRSENGASQGQYTMMSHSIIINGVNVTILDAGSRQSFVPKGLTLFQFGDNRKYCSFQVPKLGEKTEKVLIIPQEIDQWGLPQGEAVWEVELP